jgi:hypothetical protein
MRKNHIISAVSLIWFFVPVFFVFSQVELDIETGSIFSGYNDVPEAPCFPCRKIWRQILHFIIVFGCSTILIPAIIWVFCLLLYPLIQQAD